MDKLLILLGKNYVNSFKSVELNLGSPMINLVIIYVINIAMHTCNGSAQNPEYKLNITLNKSTDHVPLLLP